MSSARDIYRSDKKSTHLKNDNVVCTLFEPVHLGPSITVLNDDHCLNNRLIWFPNPHDNKVGIRIDHCFRDPLGFLILMIMRSGSMLTIVLEIHWVS